MCNFADSKWDWEGQVFAHLSFEENSENDANLEPCPSLVALVLWLLSKVGETCGRAQHEPGGRGSQDPLQRTLFLTRVSFGLSHNQDENQMFLLYVRLLSEVHREIEW